MKKNKFGRYFQPGKSLSAELQEQILDLSAEGRWLRKIGRIVHVANTYTIKNVISYNGQLDKNIGGRPAKIATEDVKLAISYYKYRKPSITTKEVRKKLIDDNITNSELSDSMLSKVLKDLKFTRKKLTVYPREGQSERNLAWYDAYIDGISNTDPMTLHFFDECSVVKITGNRSYGHAPSDLRAVELQRFASNATFTVNLLHGPMGIDYFNIINGHQMDNSWFYFS